MKSKVSKAWACGNCGRVYRHDERGKLVADQCCTCLNCGAQGSMHGGPSHSCKHCGKALEIASAEEDLKRAQARLRKARGSIE